ncbi:MAG: hypothetical protein ACREP9_20555 [Candidatus Dormibacteraceae bacterium]
MHYLDYKKVPRDAHIPPELGELSHVIRQDFPRDEMMDELHLLRVCMAMREGVLTLEESLRPESATRV